MNSFFLKIFKLRLEIEREPMESSSGEYGILKNLEEIDLDYSKIFRFTI